MKPNQSVEELIRTVARHDWHFSFGIILNEDDRIEFERVSKRHDEERKRVKEAFQELEKIGDERVVALLIETFKTIGVLDRTYISCVAWSLKQMGELAFVGLVAALDSDNANVRRWVVDCLEFFNDPRAFEPLARLLDKEQDRDVLINIIETLPKIGGQQGVEILVEALNNEQKFSRIIGRIVDILAELKDERAIPWLLLDLRDDDVHVRLSAASTLRHFSQPNVVEALAVALSDRKSSPLGIISGRVCDLAAKSLEEIGTPEALAAVAEWRKSQNQ